MSLFLCSTNFLHCYIVQHPFSKEGWHLEWVGFLISITIIQDNPLTDMPTTQMNQENPSMKLQNLNFDLLY